VAFAQELNLADAAPRIKCPLLIVFGSGDRIIPPSEGERLAAAARGPVDYVVYEEGNHVCFNITYKFRPLTADWMAEHL
jgi:2,6-dihydroxypseudooxynicotine hydrolase